MYIERIPNRNSPPAVLLRESYREGKRVLKRTLANLTDWPVQLVEGLRTLLGGGTAIERLEESFEIVRSLPHGHVSAVLGMLRRIGLERLIAPQRSPERDRVVAMVVARLINPRSKLATARGVGEESAATSLGEVLDLNGPQAEELYAAMDWLQARQGEIEKKLAQQHLQDGALVLYDVSSTYFEGRCCPLAKLGHSREGKRDKMQIVFGLLCNLEGCPIAVEVFEGNRADPKTLGAQIEKVRTRFGLARVVWVGDRGMITEARIREELKTVEGLDWITALRAPAIRQLVEAKDIQLSLFDERDLVEITSSAYPGERLIVCKNPLLAEERARQREALLQATERELDKIATATQRSQRALKGQGRIGLRVGKVIGRFKMAKHFKLTLTEDRFAYERDTQRIHEEAALDGLYVIRTSVPKETLETQQTVRAYKDLAHVERAFRSYKSVDLKVRPIYHHLAERVRAHVFLCMLAYYVEWHMRKALAPLLFDDDDKPSAERQRSSIVAPAKVSPKAARKAATRRTGEGLPVHSFQTLLADLGTITKNRIQPKIEGAEAFDRITRPTALQHQAFQLLGLKGW
ncbi:MAG: IS1634 family transposase [Gammaproteobacteria bacterium]